MGVGFYKYECSGEVLNRILIFPYCLSIIGNLSVIDKSSQYLLINIKKIDESILKKHDELITKTLLYGDDKFDLSCNKSIISSTIEFIVSTEIFSNSLV